MAFIKLHDEDNREILVNTDNVTYTERNYINFVDGDSVGIRETLDEITEIIEKAESGK